MAAFLVASGSIPISIADTDKKRELEIVANCLYREAPAFFADAGSLAKNIAWNAGLTAAEVTIKHEAAVLATYRVIETAQSIEVSSPDHPFPDEATKERHSSMVSRCLFEAGYDSILINKN